MVKIDLLKNHVHTIPALTEMWYELIAKFWNPGCPGCVTQSMQNKLGSHLNTDAIPLTFVAFDGPNPVGMCSLREEDCTRPDLGPWLGSFVVNKSHQGHGIGKMLFSRILDKAVEIGLSALYLVAFDPKVVGYYKKLGWYTIDFDLYNGHKVTVMQFNII